MRKVKTAFIALVLALVMAMPTVAIARPLDEVPKRTENGVVFVPLRLTAYAHGATVEWDGANRAVLITSANGDTWAVVVESIQVGGFIEDGTSWIPYEYAVNLFSDAKEAEAIATEFMNRLVAGDIAGATLMRSAETQDFDLNMMMFLPRGNLINFTVLEISYDSGVHTFDLATTHTMGTANYRINVNDGGEITVFTTLDFVFEPMLPPENASYTAEAIIVGEATDWPLDGIITIPENASSDNPVPAVILVHGSGANNMDLSVFNNRPFFDIADYLSSNGIAVLRYNKRTFSHGAAYTQAFGSSATLWEESIEDALLAAEMLRADERVGDVFVAGLSMGGLLAPRIAEEGNLDGAILLAAPARPMFEVSASQMIQANIDAINDLIAAGAMTQEEADELLASIMVAIGELLEEAQNMPNMTEAELAEAEIFGAPAIYQLSWAESPPQIFITRNTFPVLILHGDRDWQVLTEEDFNVLVNYTQGMAHVQAILYDNVNHIFMQSQTSYNDIRDYAPVDRVYNQVLRDIVDWIMGQ